MYEQQALAGAQNLLKNCAAATPGQRLLLAYEPANYGYFDEAAAQCVVVAARHLGLTVRSIDVGFNPQNPHLPESLLNAMADCDLVVFLARLGDQLRFSTLPDGKPMITSFALTKGMFASPFATAHHGAFQDIKDRLDQSLARARTIKITCPSGTEVSGRPDPTRPQSSTSITRFPCSVFAPIPASGFSGRVALPGFLAGTGSRYYSPYAVYFSGPVMAHMDDGQLTGFEGATKDVDAANRHYDSVSAKFGLARNTVHSWHAGIHPGCAFPWPMRDQVERWSGAAFGNPRILHFHTCGENAPGEISWNVIDPTVMIDGVALWDDGRLCLDRLFGGSQILKRYRDVAQLFQNPRRDIGLVEAS